MILDIKKNYHSGVGIAYFQESIGEEFPDKINPNIKALKSDAILNADDNSPLSSEEN